MLLLSPLKPFLLAPRLPFLRFGAAGEPPPPPDGGDGWQGATFADVPSAWARWQADALGDHLNDPAAWGGASTGLKDRSGNGRNLAAGSAAAAPRVNRSYGALDLRDPSAVASVAGADLRGNAAWTLALVFTRADYKANPRGSDAHVIADLGGQRILQVTERSASNALSLFPAGANATLRAGCPRSLTYGVVLRNQPGQGVTAWVVDADAGTVAPAATGIACPITATGTLRLLSENGGSGRLLLHQAGLWARAVTDNEAATLVDACRKYKLGRRRSAGVLFLGQSWAGYAVGNDGVVGDVAMAVQGMIGGPGFSQVDVDPALWNGSTCDAYGLAGAYYEGAPDYWTTQGGQPVWDIALSDGAFLDATAGRGSIESWPFGWTGQGLQRFIQNIMTAEDRADCIAVLHWHTEQDSKEKQLSDLADHKRALRRLMQLVRAEMGRSAAALPWFQVAAFPYGGNAGGCLMVNQAWGELAAEAAQNFHVALGNTSDVGPRDGSDWDHPDQASQQRWGKLAAYGIARVLTDQGLGDSLAPARLPGRGPEAIHAEAESATSTLITVRHDQGAALKLNGDAATGNGWWLDDNGVERAVSAVAIAGPAQLRLTHAACTGTVAQRRVAYCSRGERTEPGNVITDDWSDQAKAPEADIPALHGAAWNVDFPLRAFPAPMPLSDYAYGATPPAGWILDAALSDDFTGTGAPDAAVWHHVYAATGQNGGTYDIDPAQIAVGGGVCTITTGNVAGTWKTGAMMTGGTAQGQAGFLYGQVDIRARADAGQGWGPNLLLWPADDSWPPEIDILEAPEAAKDKAWAVLHWPPGNNQDGAGYAVDVTQWHVYSLRWQPNLIEWFVDGQRLRTWTANVPDVPMQIGIQGFVAAAGDAWYGGGPTAGSGPFLFEIDYVQTWRP